MALIVLPTLTLPTSMPSYSRNPWTTSNSYRAHQPHHCPWMHHDFVTLILHFSVPSYRKSLILFPYLTTTSTYPPGLMLGYHSSLAVFFKLPGWGSWIDTQLPQTLRIPHHTSDPSVLSSLLTWQPPTDPKKPREQITSVFGHCCAPIIYFSIGPMIQDIHTDVRISWFIWRKNLI